MTSHKIRLKNIRKMKQEVPLEDKSAIAANEMGDISAQMCDHFGNVIIKTKLTNLAMIQSRYNLFSCTKMRIKSWILVRNTEAIWLRKGKEIIKFDIKISTPKEMIFAMYMQ